MEILYLARYKNCKQVFGILRRTMLTLQRCKEPSAYSGRQQHLFSHWYDADGERTVKTSGENEAIYVNSDFSGGNTGTARFSLYVSPYLVAGQGGKYTKHIYVGSQRIVSKLGDLASYGVDPRRIPYAGNEADGLTINYKVKYAKQLQSIKDNYKAFDLPYNGQDNDDYVNGQVCLKDIVGCTRESLSKLTFLSFARQFCCNDATPEAAQARAMARTRAESGNFKPNDDYEKMQFFYHPDHLGSSSYITNLDGEVSQHIEYVPFGEVFIEERNNIWNTPYLFNAKEFDEETGMYYYGARYYEPRLSLWMSCDPMEEKYPDISSYTYCHNNPITLIDPNGMTDYYNLNGKLVRNVDDGKTDRIMLLINSKKDDKVNAAIEQGTFIKVPSNKVVDKMEEAYNLTENTGKEHGFRVGNKGTISTMASGRETEIGPDEWKPAVSSIVEQGDLVSYDVHTHPKPKYEQGSQTIPFNNMPSETDQMNTVGNQPSVVLGYYFQEIRNLNTFGSGQTDISLHRSICFYNKNGAINLEEIRFSDFKSAVKKINKEQ